MICGYCLHRFEAVDAIKKFEAVDAIKKLYERGVFIKLLNLIDSLTYDNLRKRGYILTSWCCMCCCGGETADHLLLHCSVAAALWSWVFQSFGVQWVISGNRFLAVQLVEWVREALFGYLEYGAYLFDVDYLEGTQSTYF